MTEIKTKHYIRISFILSSPLLISSSASVSTDNDVLLDSRGKPYIPGSSIAGAVREALDHNGIEVNKYFGYMEKNTGSGNSKQTESRLVFHDAYPEEGSECRIAIRDSVSLDDFKTAVDGNKFDMEIVEPGVEFITYIEQNCAKDDKEILTDIAKAIMSGKVRFGSKTTRGFGCITDVKAWEESFDMTKAEEVTNWLDFDPFAEKAWTKEASATADDSGCSLVLKLKLKDGLSIRQYTTEVSEDKKEAVPDYRQLTIQGKDGSTIPVIPGASWAGAFIHRIRQLMPAAAEDNENKSTISLSDYFGLVEGNKKRKSLITFSESQIKGGQDKKISRTAIDRFSGSAAKGSLYTEMTHYGGSCELIISFSKLNNGCYSDQFIEAFAAAIADLHFGYLAVGGLTSVGRGLFTVISINGSEVNDDTVYQTAKEALENINDTFRRSA